jgi:hypothetical protein
MIKKILIERNFVPDNKFDWSLFAGDVFKKFDPNDNHSSFSSCNIQSDEEVDNECIRPFDKLKNIKKLKDYYSCTNYKSAQKSFYDAYDHGDG